RDFHVAGVQTCALPILSAANTLLFARSQIAGARHVPAPDSRAGRAPFRRRSCSPRRPARAELNTTNSQAARTDARLNPALDMCLDRKSVVEGRSISRSR